MKRLTLFVLLLSIQMIGQEEVSTSERFEMNWLWKFQLIQPAPFGDNAIAKGHESNLGVGFQLGLFKYGNFRFGAGYDFTTYSVVDVPAIGNMDSSKYTSVFGFLSYEIPVYDKFSFIPDIGYGYAKLKQEFEGARNGTQDGNDYRVGFTGNYNFSEHSSVYLGVHYIHTKLDVATHPDYEKFYGQMHQIQFAVGIAFD